MDISDNPSNIRRKLTIAVTGLNAIDSPGPGVAVIRAIRESTDFEVRIIGLSYEALEPGIYMHELVDKTYQIPYPSAGAENRFNRLVRLREPEKLNFVIPNLDAELYSFIKLKDRLSNLGIRTFLPDLEQFEARHKTALFAFGKKHHLKVPEDRIVNQLSDLVKAADELDYPLVIKGKYYDATIVNSRDEAQKAFYKLQAKWGLPVIAQQFINGTEINIAILGDGNGNTISVIPMRKLYITDKGKAWAGITIEDPTYLNLAHKFVKATKWRGGCELEIMQTAAGISYIMEVNPRFPAWIYLSAAAGQNQPAALVRMALGEKVEPFKSYTVGKMFIRYAWDLVTDVGEFQQISIRGEL